MSTGELTSPFDPDEEDDISDLVEIDLTEEDIRQITGVPRDPDEWEAVGGSDQVREKHLRGE